MKPTDGYELRAHVANSYIYIFFSFQPADKDTIQEANMGVIKTLQVFQVLLLIESFHISPVSVTSSWL